MKDEKQEGDLRNQLHAIRTRLGLSQRELAAAAGIARQTIGGIEAGLYAPSAAVALRLAKALGCRVEDLFWLEDNHPTLEAVLSAPLPEEASFRVTLAQVNGRWVAHPLVADQAFRTEMIPADGIGCCGETPGTIAVQLLDEPETLARTVLLAGCAPALSLWARSAERWYPGLRVHWVHANSTQALEALACGAVHAAGVHLHDAQTGQDNAPFVRRILGEGAAVLVTLGSWEEGLLVAAGNPRQIKEVTDIAREDVTLVNREQGAGARMLLDALLEQERIASERVSGYRRIVFTHQDVAREVQAGRADIGVGIASVATAYGLGFVPLREVRYDLALRKETLDFPPVQQLLGTLRHRWVASQLGTLGGFDTHRTGEILEV